MTDTEDSPNQQQRLLAELRAAGESDSTGFFTVDEKLLVQKLRHHQLRDPHEFALNLVQAASAAGAREIEIDASLTGIQVSIRGWTLPEHWIRHPFDGLLLSADTAEMEAVRELSTALNAAMALRPGCIEVVSGALRTRIWPPGRIDTRPAVDEAGFGAPVNRGIDIRIHHLDLAKVAGVGATIGIRTVVIGGVIIVGIVGSIIPFFWFLLGFAELANTKIDPEPTATACVRERALPDRLKVTVNGSPVRYDPPEDIILDREIKLSTGSFRLMLRDTALDEAYVLLVKNSVLLCGLRADVLPWPHAVIHADRIVKDLSSGAPVEDDAWRAVLDDFRKACSHLILDLIKRYEAAPIGSSRYRPHLLRAAGHVLDPSQAREGDPSVREALATCRLFQLGTGSRASIQDLRARAALDGRLLLSRHGGSPTCVMLQHPSDRACLQALFGSVLQELP